MKVWRVDDDMVTTVPTSNGTPTSSSKPRLSDINGPNVPGSSVHQTKHHHRQKTLSGRNCLLGSLIEATFTSVTVITDEKAIVCTKGGDLCLLDDSEKSQKFYKISNIGFEITASAFEAEKDLLHIAAGLNGNIQSFTISELMTLSEKSEQLSSSTSSTFACVFSPTSKSVSETRNVSASGTGGDGHYIALSPLNGSVVAIDNQRSIRLLKISSESSPSVTRTNSVIQKLHAHRDSVLGVRTLANQNYLRAAFYTWSVDGSVLFWNRDGKCMKSFEVDLEQEARIVNAGSLGIGSGFEDDGPNELRAVDVTKELDYMLSGDKLGVLR